MNLLNDCDDNTRGYVTGQIDVDSNVAEYDFKYISGKLNEKIILLKDLIRNVLGYTDDNEAKADLNEFINELNTIDGSDPKDFLQDIYNKDKSEKDSNSTMATVSNILNDVQNRYNEYYLMCKTIGHYDCCYPDTLRRLSNFYYKSIINNNIFCAQIKYTLDFMDKIDDIKNYIKTNNINEDDDTEDKHNQEVDNARNKLQTYISNKQSYIDKTIRYKDEFLDFLVDIVYFLNGMKGYLKLIGLSQALMLCKEEEEENFLNISTGLTTYYKFNNDLNKRANLDMKLTYEIVERQILKYGIPIILEFKKYLKDDLSNFDSISQQGILYSANQSMLGTYCSRVKDDLDALNA